MTNKSLKRILSVFLALLISSSCFAMNIRAAEENVAYIGDVYYNSLQQALSAAVSGDTVVLAKDTTLTQDAEVKSGVKLVVPHRDGYAGYDVTSSTPSPEVNETTSAQPEVLFRTLTINSGVTLTVNGSVQVTAVVGVFGGGPAKNGVNGAYAQIILNGKMNVNSGGRVVSDGYIKGSGTIEAFSGAEIRDCFMLVHWRGGSHASYMRVQGVWPANEYDCNMIQVKIIIHSGAKFTGKMTTSMNDEWQHNIVTMIASSGALFIINDGGYAVKTYEYRERISGYAEVINLYGGGYIGEVSLKVVIVNVSASFNSSSFVMSVDGDYEVHFHDGTYYTYDGSSAKSMKFMPGSEVTVHSGATVRVDRYIKKSFLGTTVSTKTSKFSFYEEMLDSNFAEKYRYPQGRPAARLNIENGATLYVDGEIGGNIYLGETATVIKGNNVSLSTSVKESAELGSNSTETKTYDAVFHLPEGYHTTSWTDTTFDAGSYDSTTSKQKMVIEACSYVLTSTEKAVTCTSDGVNVLTCSVCGSSKKVTVPATGHAYKSVVTAPTCTESGYTTHTCANCGDSYTDGIVSASGHKNEEIAAIAPDCTHTGLTAGVKCSVCGKILTSQQTVPMLGHTEEKISATDATCTLAGLTAGTKCSLCGEVLEKQETIAALGHKEVTDAAIEPTCTQTGLTEGKHCETCGEVLVKQETIAALGHKEVTDAAVEPTCTQTGLTEGKHCETCGEVFLQQTVLSATGHTFGEWIFTTAATFTSDGEKIKYCEKCDLSESVTVSKTELITDRIHMSVDGDNITFVSCVNANNIAFSVKAKNGETVEVPQMSPVKKTSNGQRYVVYYKDWVKAGGVCETTLTVAGKTYNLSIIMAGERSLSESDIIVGGVNGVGKRVDNENAVITLALPSGTTEFTLRDVSYNCDEFTYSLATDENVSLVNVKDEGYDEYVFTLDGETPIEKTVLLNDGKLGEKEYTLKVIYSDYDVLSDIKLVRGTASFDEDGTLRLTMRDGLSASTKSVGIYTATKNNAAVELISFEGVYDTGRTDMFISYASKNAVNPQGSFTITLPDSIVYEYDIVFDIGLGDASDEFDLLAELRLIRCTAFFDEDGKLVLQMNSGLTESTAAVGVYAKTKSGAVLKIQDATGTFDSRTDAYVAYKKKNLSNPTGTIVLTLSDASVYEYEVVFDIGLADEEGEYDVLSDLRLIRGDASLDSDGTVRLTVQSGKTCVGVYVKTSSGAKLEIVDSTGTFDSRTDAYVAYKNKNAENPTGKMIITLSNGEVKEYNVIFDIGK